jgi:hypothetical protein
MASATQSAPSAEQKKMGAFLGRWRTTGEVAATESEPAAEVDSIDIYEWYPGEFFLVHHADGRVGGSPIKSIEIMGYDPERQCYFAPFFDSTGDFGTEEIRFDENKWIWRGSNVMGVKEHRCIAVVSDDGQTIEARHEKSDDGQSWVLWMDVTLRKQG